MVKQLEYIKLPYIISSTTICLLGTSLIQEVMTWSSGLLQQPAPVTHLLTLVVEQHPMQDGVFPQGQVHRSVLLLPPDAQSQHHLASLMFAGVRVQGQSTVLPLDGRGPQDVERTADEVALLLMVSVVIWMKIFIAKKKDPTYSF